MNPPPVLTVRPIDPRDDAEVELVARRMRLTLIEVLGDVRGGALYTLDWLRARVRWHLDPEACVGRVFVAERDRVIVGHTIVRLERDETDEPLGLFSTTWVAPEARRRGVADALLIAGEAWFLSHGMRRAATDTSASNTGLIRLFEERGYEVTFRDPGLDMVRLTRALEDRPFERRREEDGG